MPANQPDAAGDHPTPDAIDRVPDGTHDNRTPDAIDRVAVPAGFPSGVFVTAITAQEAGCCPPLVGTWRWTFDGSGNFDLRGPFDVGGTYAVAGDHITFQETTNAVCATPGTYLWSFDGQSISLRSSDTPDPCSEGDRAFHWTTQPWTKA